MKKTIILVLLLVSVIGCVEQKTITPNETDNSPRTTLPTITTTPIAIQTNNNPTNTPIQNVTNNSAEDNTTADNNITNNNDTEDNTTANNNIANNNDTEENSTIDNSTTDNELDKEIDYDVNEPPDEEPECYDNNGKDIPCPPD